MADSSVPISAGSGTSIDTRTESTNSNHRQVMVIGDPATNAGVAPVDVAAGLKVDLGADNDVHVKDSGGTNITDVTAHALKILQVDSAGSAIASAVAATVDSITAKLATDTIQNGLVALTPKFAVIAASASGNNTIVAAVTSKKIRVLSYNFIANGIVNAKFQSGASGTDITGLKYCVANSGISVPFCPVGLFETAAGVLLNLNLSAAIAVGGELTYVEI